MTEKHELLRRNTRSALLALPLLIVALISAAPSYAATTDKQITAADPQTLFEQKNYEAAAKALLATSRTRRLTAEETSLLSLAYYSQGLIDYKAGNKDQGTRLFAASVQTNPKNPSANFALGFAYEEQRQYYAAVKYYAIAAQLSPEIARKTAARLKSLGQDLIGQLDGDLDAGMYGLAKEKMQFVARHCEGAVTSELGDKWVQLQGELEAVELYLQAETLASRNRKDQAINMLREITEKHPDSRVANNARELLLDSGQKAYIPATATGFKLSSDWKKNESPHFVVFSQKGSSTAAFMKAGEDALVEILKDLGSQQYPLNRKIKMYLFEDRDTWADFLSKNRNRTMEWSGGFAVPVAGEIYLYVTDTSSTLRRSVMPHELAHIIHRNYIGVDKYQPLWLTEGFAMMQEEDGVRGYEKIYEQLYENEELIPLARLITLDLRRADKIAVSLFYIESVVLLDLIADEFGPNRVKQMMVAFAEGGMDLYFSNEKAVAKFEEVVRKTLGVDVQRLEKMWLKRLGK